MKNILVIKNRIKYIFRNSSAIYRVLRVIYSFIFHPDRIIKRTSYGYDNPKETILVIRPNSQDGMQGLLSLYIQALRWIEFADRHGYIPVVDYKNYKTQYYIEGINAWELFFKQPAGLDLNEAYTSKNVILSGVGIKKTTDDSMFRDAIFTDLNLFSKCCKTINKFNLFTSEEIELLEQENKRINVDNCIGVYIRGTDYVKLKPTGEYKQPNISDVIIRIRQFREKYDYPPIFLVTEDYEYYTIISHEFNDCLKTVSYDNYIRGYDGERYLYQTGLLEEDKKKRGIDYLVKILLLSKCRYFVGSITNGSIIAYCLNGHKYEDEYIFNLGYYD